jgi:hypothetical protein
MANRKSAVAKTATQALQVLWQEAFFRNARKWSDIERSLGKRGNNFSTAELGMALKRARHLTRRGKRGHYEYIQKYPFVGEDRIAAKGLKQKP